MNLYEHTIIAKQSHSASQLQSLKTKYLNIIEKNEGEIIKIDDWGLLNLSHEINNNKKGNYIHFKLKGSGPSTLLKTLFARNCPLGQPEKSLWLHNGFLSRGRFVLHLRFRWWSFVWQGGIFD